ncbi:MAG TPA: hypothetical protein VE522_00140 [Actinomycetota bacterium]|nr:hypothetical protein [Actinomycetota bacterium]
MIDVLIARVADVFDIVLAADGAGSTLDADLLDGQSSAAFASSSHVHSGADITSGTVARRGSMPCWRATPRSSAS